MGFKDKFFSEKVEKDTSETDEEFFSSSVSSAEKIKQLSEYYKDAFKNGETIVEKYDASIKNASGDTIGASADGVLGSSIIGGDHKIDYAENPVSGNIDNEKSAFSDNETETKTGKSEFKKNSINYEIDNSPLSKKEEEDLKFLDESDPGYISGDVLDYSDEQYLKTGKHQVDWKTDSVEGTKERVIVKPSENEEPTVLLQYSFPGKTGTYFAEPKTKYESLQLPEIEAKREVKYYEVIKDLPMEKSLINNQRFLHNGYNPDTYQFVPEMKNKEGKTMSAGELVDAGYLRECKNKIDSK